MCRLKNVFAYFPFNLWFGFSNCLAREIVPYRQIPEDYVEHICVSDLYDMQKFSSSWTVAEKKKIRFIIAVYSFTEV